MVSNKKGRIGLKIYTYTNCSTCRKTTKFLDAQGIAYPELTIREQPSTNAELNQMLGHLHGELKKLFNTSGVDYRALKLKDALPTMSTAKALDLLHSNGNLVKRPFVLAKGTGTTGFKEDVWKTLFL